MSDSIRIHALQKEIEQKNERIAILEKAILEASAKIEEHDADEGNTPALDEALLILASAHIRSTIKWRNLK